MLKQLTLHNFVLVEQLDIAFGPGLTTITGESGAGKSILLSALGLLLGERANTDVIRPDADKADVSAEFDLSDLPAVRTMLVDDDLLEEGATDCLVRRVVSRQGRSRAFIEGVPVTTGQLRRLGEQLVEIHGQQEHVRLADRHVQLALLDDFAGLSDAAAKVRNSYRQWQQTLTELAERQAAQQADRDRRDLLEYQLEELTGLGLGAGEFEQLESDHKRLAQAQQILDTLHRTETAIDDADALRQALRQLQEIDDNHSDLAAARENLNAALNLMDDSLREVRHYRDQVTDDPARLSEVEERLNEAQSLARKHRVDPLALHAHGERLREALATIEADDSAVETLTAQGAKLEAAFSKAATGLSKKRRKAAPGFCERVAGYMQTLGIKDGQLAVQFTDTQSERGIDRAEYHVTTNPRFPAGPLAQIASGGEQTRIALAIQIVAAATSALPCLILDEADVGVGGTTADTVGRLLRDLGAQAQVICITHAPQVAALGNHHFRVVKDGEHTEIQTLSDEHRVEELARMLAGAGITEKTRDYAATLLAGAAEEA